MLVIECYNKQNIKSEYVKCPNCKRGRICDKPVGEKVTVAAVTNLTTDGPNDSIILKCPKCGQKVIISISNE